MKSLTTKSTNSTSKGYPGHPYRPLLAESSASIKRSRNKTKTTRVCASQTNTQATAEVYKPFPTIEAAPAYEHDTIFKGDDPMFNRFVATIPWTAFKIRVKTLTGRTFSVDLILGTLVRELKEHIRRIEGIPPDQQRIIYRGWQLEDDLTVDHYGVKNNDVLHLVLRLRGGGTGVRAEAIVLKGWDGVIEGLRQQSQINAGERLYFSRVIDENWLEGRTEKSFDPIIFPISFVAITDVDTNMEAGLRGIDRNFKVWNKADALGAISFYSSLSAVLPPPPPSEILALDEFFKRTRIRIMFYRRVQDKTVGLLLSCISSPNSRVSNATIRLTFQDGIILDIEPGNLIEGPSTTATHSVKASRTFSFTLGLTSAPQATAGNQSHQSSTVEYTRSTANHIVGDGIGSNVAYWIMKEDTGEAGRRGLPSHSEMSVRLNILPVTFEYEAKATLVFGDGVAASWWNTRSFSSGKRSVVFK